MGKEERRTNDRRHAWCGVLRASSVFRYSRGVKSLSRLCSTLLLFFVSGKVAAYSVLFPGFQNETLRQIVVHFNPSQCRRPSTLQSALEAAITFWNRTASLPFKIVLKPSPSEEPLNRFFSGDSDEVPLVACDTRFGRQQHLDNPRVPAITRVSHDDPVHYSAIILNAEANSGASVDGFGVEGLTLILAHELGHVVGLGHSNQKEALMYPELDLRKRLFLSRDDRDAISVLYNETRQRRSALASIRDFFSTN